jgi:hypothetical protein
MKTRRIILILFALLGFSISAVLSQTTLRDILSDESCQYACYLGIKPGESSQLELENILNALEIEYEVCSAVVFLEGIKPDIREDSAIEPTPPPQIPPV